MDHDVRRLVKPDETLLPHDRRRGLVKNETLLPHDRRRGLLIDVTARLLAADDDIVAGAGVSHADRGAAATLNRYARAS